MTYRNRILSLVMAATALCLIGCVGGKSPSARFFQLQPVVDLASTAETPLDAAYAVILRPVTLESYLNRSQMVNRVSPYEINYRELARWAEPLDGNITRVLAENLRRLLQTDCVAIFPHAAPELRSMTINVDISRFEGKPGDQAVLNAAWIVRMETNGKVVNQYKKFSAPVAGTRIEDAAAAQAGLLADLSKLIAEDVLSLATATPEPAAESAAP